MEFEGIWWQYFAGGYFFKNEENNIFFTSLLTSPPQIILIAPISWQALTTAIAFIASVNFTPFKI
jgi:hypothetical protein